MKTALLAILFLTVAAFEARSVPVDINSFGSAYSQDFNSLATSGTENTSLPAGWELTESGGGARDNEKYGADTGGSNTGDTYSYGAAGSTDRALGGLRSGTLSPLFGVHFSNQTGGNLTSLLVSYVGEQWRLGTAGRVDRLDFEYSVDATSLTGGTWIGVDALDFSTPDTTTTGAKDGNAAANQTIIASTISGLNIGDGAGFWLRWTDVDASGADDGLAIDDFSLTAFGVLPPTSTVPDTGATSLLLIIPLFGLLMLRRYATQNRLIPVRNFAFAPIRAD